MLAKCLPQRFCALVPEYAETQCRSLCYIALTVIYEEHLRRIVVAVIIIIIVILDTSKVLEKVERIRFPYTLAVFSLIRGEYTTEAVKEFGVDRRR